jgi:hypothetical protein
MLFEYQASIGILGLVPGATKVDLVRPIFHILGTSGTTQAILSEPGLTGKNLEDSRNRWHARHSVVMFIHVTNTNISFPICSQAMDQSFIQD